MTIDCTLAPGHEEIKTRVRAFIAERTIAAYEDTGSTWSATGGLPL